jgi:hypothetical protein
MQEDGKGIIFAFYYIETFLNLCEDRMETVICVGLYYSIFNDLDVLEKLNIIYFIIFTFTMVLGF